MKKSKSNSELSVSLFGFSFVFFSLIVFIISILVNNFLPESLNTQEEISEFNKFVTNRAFKNLEVLSNIGPRVTGNYENEVLAVQYLKQEINEIIYSSPKQYNEILYDLQIVSGCFTLNLKGVTKTTCYQNIQNIVIKLKPLIFTNVSETILLNCHFDSVPTSPGTSDDGLNCAVLLEILRVLSKTNNPLKKNVIFLFNGAEEVGLQASHGFITQHKWAKNISCFINLESCGAGGREILFQTGPNAYILPKMYAGVVPYPYGNVIGEELFQSGVLPSDTDFRIFRDFGHIKGLDFAHYKNGYVYHTSIDNLSQISKNVILHTGNNILALLQSLIEQENLKKIISESNEQAVFFDVFGLFMICYSVTTAVFINYIALLFSIYVIIDIFFKIFEGITFKSALFHFGINFLFTGFGLFVSLLVLNILANLLKQNGLIMLWFSNSWFLLAYYGIAALYIKTTFIKLRRLFSSKLNRENEAYLFILITQILNTFLLFVGIIFKIRSNYLLVINLVPLSTSLLLLKKTKLKNECVGKKMMLFIIVNFLSSLYMTYLAVQITRLLIPMTGRLGVEKDSETLMWFLCYFFSYFIFSYFMPLVLLVKNWWKVQLSVSICYALFVITILFNAIQLSTFGEETPQRFSILHVHRKLINSNVNSSTNEKSGYFLIPMDNRANQTIQMLFPDIKYKKVGDICNEELFCGFPLMYSYLLHTMKLNYFVEAEKPLILREKQLQFKTVESNNTRTFYLNFTGPGYFNLLILPLNNAELTEWSLFSDKIKSVTNWLNQKVYLIHHTRGLEITPQWSCWLKFDISNMSAEAFTFKLAWSIIHYSNNTTHFTPNFQKFIDRFPIWIQVVPGIAEHEEYLF